MDLEQRAKELAEREQQDLPVRNESNQLPSEGFSFNSIQQDFLRKQVAQGKTLNEISTDFTKALITDGILNDESPEAERFRKELAEQQKETLKESFRQDTYSEQTKTIDEKQKKAEAFYKSFRPILEFDFDNLIKRKETKVKDEDVRPQKTYADRSYGIPLMVLMLILLTLPYCCVSILLALFNGVNAILEEINTFGKVARYIVLSVVVIIFAILIIYIALCGIERLFNVDIIPN
jgi:hypothetical protein